MRNVKPKGETFKYIDIDSIDNAKCEIKQPKIIPTSKAPSRATRHTKKGDTLFAMVRPYLRNIAIVNENDCIASTGFFVCSPKEVLLPKYCYFMMTSDYVVRGLNQYMKGDNSPSINNNNILNWVYPIPPFEEQVRIVKQTEMLFALLDSIAAEL